MAGLYQVTGYDWSSLLMEEQEPATVTIPLSPIPSPVNDKFPPDEVLQKISLMGRAVVVAWWTAARRYRASGSSDDMVKFKVMLNHLGTKNEDAQMWQEFVYAWMQQERYGMDGMPLDEESEYHIVNKLIDTTRWGYGPDSALENALWFPIRPGGARKYKVWEGVDELLLDLDPFTEPTHVLQPTVRNSNMDFGVMHPVKIWDGVRGHVYKIPFLPAGAQDEQSTISAPLDIRRIPTIGNMKNSPYRYPKPANLPRSPPRSFVRKTEIAETRESGGDGKPGTLTLTTVNEREWNDPWLGPHENDFRRLWSDDVTATGIKEGEGRIDWGLDWSEYLCERQLDQEGRELYFVFNIGPSAQPLKINGATIDPGRIAGPLPPFAVIQTVGDHVGFWWGVRGARYMPGRPLEPRRFLYPGEPHPAQP